MRSILFACTALAAFLGATSAFGAAMVIGTGPAQGCYQAARADRSDLRSLETCNQALDGDLNRHDRVATRVNRGIILINRRQPEAALADFDRALRMNPELGEAHVNRGAALMMKNEYEAAVEAITRGIGLNTEEPHKAYYNRAIAYEAIGNVRAAYEDYTRAAELAPEWAQPRTELTRFTVRRVQP
jgi:tetratricopeptide (TPR) repeat protein